jgi:hypothetical protein
MPEDTVAGFRMFLRWLHETRLLHKVRLAPPQTSRTRFRRRFNHLPRHIRTGGQVVSAGVANELFQVPAEIFLHGRHSELRIYHETLQPRTIRGHSEAVLRATKCLQRTLQKTLFDGQLAVTRRIAIAGTPRMPTRIYHWSMFGRIRGCPRASLHIIQNRGFPRYPRMVQDEAGLGRKESGQGGKC